MTTDTVRTARVAARLAVVKVQGRNVGPFVVPMISTVVTLTLGADGSLKDARLTASSTSHAGDSLVLAAVRRAAGTDAFPRLEGTTHHVDTVTVELAVSMAEPAPGDQAVALGWLNAPAWRSASAAHLAEMPSPSRDWLGQLGTGGLLADTAALEFVVSDRGKALPATARLDYSVASPLSGDDPKLYARRLVSLLREFSFDAGRIAGCRVPEFIGRDSATGCDASGSGARRRCDHPSPALAQ